MVPPPAAPAALSSTSREGMALTARRVLGCDDGLLVTVALRHQGTAVLQQTEWGIT